MCRRHLMTKTRFDCKIFANDNDYLLLSRQNVEALLIYTPLLNKFNKEWKTDTALI